MTTEPTENLSMKESSDTRQSTTEEGAPPQVLKPFHEAYSNYMQRFCDGWEAAHEGLRGAQCKHNEAYQTLRSEAEKDCTAATERYQKAMREITAAMEGSEEDSSRRHREAAVHAHFAYQEELRKLNDGTAERWQDLQKSYAETVRRAQEQYQKHCEESYEAYVRELQDAWRKLKGTHVDPVSLAQISQLSGCAAQLGSPGASTC